MRRRQGLPKTNECPCCGEEHKFPWQRCSQEALKRLRHRSRFTETKQRDDKSRLNEGLELMELYEEMYEDV